jgi:hypothetical protein
MSCAIPWALGRPEASKRGRQVVLYRHKRFHRRVGGSLGAIDNAGSAQKEANLHVVPALVVQISRGYVLAVDAPESDEFTQVALRRVLVTNFKRICARSDGLRDPARDVVLIEQSGYLSVVWSARS